MGAFCKRYEEKMKQLILLILILFLFVSPSLAGPQAENEVKRGNLLYNKGSFEDALEKYEQALLDSPDSDIVNFNLGNALYKIKDYEKAVTHYEKSLVLDDQSLEQKASYNLGNTKYKNGIGREDTDLQGAVNLLEQSLRHYERAIELVPDDEDAKYNYEFVKKELERLKEKLKKQQQQKQSQQDKKDSDKQEEEDKQQQPQQKKPEQEEPQEKEDQQQGDKQPEEDKEETSQGDKSQQDKGEDKRDSQQGRSPKQSKNEMSEKEAEMLLDNYRHEEEPRGLYKEKIQVQGLPGVLKDW